MPVLIPSNELQPGMRLDRPLRSGDRTLLAADKPLSKTDVELLQKRFPDLMVRVADPILDENVNFEDDTKEREVADTVRRQIGHSMSEVQSRFSERASLAGVDFGRVKRAVEDILRYLTENPSSAALLSKTLDGDNYLSHHTGNVFYLSMMLATAVRSYILQERVRQTQLKEVNEKTMLDLTPLGLGAMFMDIGMLPLQHLYKKNGNLTEEERKQVREHPLRGAEMLPDDFSAMARVVVKTHHENYNGTGYPRGLARDKLQVFSRIVRIADAYDAATSQRVYRQAKSPARALWEMSEGPYRNLYDPVLTKVFSNLIQPFPIGAKLRLADGRYAVVVKYNRRSPFYPHVLIAYDRDNKRLPNNDLDGPFCLAERPSVHVAYWGDENISYIYESNSVGDPVRPRDFTSLFEASYP